MFKPGAGVVMGAAALLGLIVAGWMISERVAFAQRLEFEVASVKPNTADGPSDMRGPRRSGETVVMHNTSLYSMLFYAYHLTGSYQMVGYQPLGEGFNWFDIETRAAASATDEQVRLMFQSLLEDRFKLKLHREMREVAGYEVKIGKGKVKLQPAKDGPMTVTIEGKTFPAGEGKCSTTLWSEGGHVVCHAANSQTIVNEFGRLLQAPIVDETELTGIYDLNLLYLPEERRLEANAPLSPPLEAAVQELGLKIEKGKAPVEVIVIDHVEKPSAN